jgi:hypothetical protein
MMQDQQTAIFTAWLHWKVTQLHTVAPANIQTSASGFWGKKIHRT